MKDVQGYLGGYLERYRDYKDYWNYEDGCVLMGCARLFEAGAGDGYGRYVMDYLNRRVLPDGSIPTYETTQYNIDSINSGKLLFFAKRQSGDSRWDKAIEYHMQRLREHPRCENGSFWHKSIYPHQVWLDGLYMALPFYTDYEMDMGGKREVADILRQFDNVRRLMHDSAKGLHYHGWDESRAMFWANPDTGCSPNFWLRSLGWHLMALVDCCDQMSETLYEHKRRLQDLLLEAVRGLLPYQSQSGLFYQVADQPETPGNYEETSGSAMAAYAIMKGARIGALHRETYAPIGRGIFDSLVRDKLVDGPQGLQLKDICLVAGLGGQDQRDGSVAYYLSEPRVSDDAKGVGPFMMAYAEALLQDAPPRSRRAIT